MAPHLTNRLHEYRYEFVRFAYVILLCFASVAAIAKDSSSSTDNLSILEKRFFQQAYPTESTDQRLDRLEEMVFGARREGSAKQRITSLWVAVNQNSLPDPGDEVQTDNTVPPSSSGTATSAPSDHGGGSAQTTENNRSENERGANEGSYTGNSSPSTDSYPTITALEEQLLGKTYQAEPVEQRLDRLEIKSFGKASNLDDLGKRVDLLKAFTAKRNGQSSDYLTSSEPQFHFASTLHPMDLTQELGLLERSIFGKVYARDGLISRVDRLETAVFKGQPHQTFNSITARVNRLMAAVQPQAAPGYSPIAQQAAPGYSPTMQQAAPGYSPAMQQAAPGYSPIMQQAAPGYSPIMPQEDTRYPQVAAAQPAPWYRQQSSASTQSMSAGQYASYPYTNPNPPFNNSASGFAATTQPAKADSHPILHRLASVLGGLGTMAAGSMGMGSFLGNTGYGGYSRPGYGYGSSQYSNYRY
jgi:hypothetical protein